MGERGIDDATEGKETGERHGEELEKSFIDKSLGAGGRKRE